MMNFYWERKCIAVTSPKNTPITKRLLKKCDRLFGTRVPLVPTSDRLSGRSDHRSETGRHLIKKRNRLIEKRDHLVVIGDRLFVNGVHSVQKRERLSAIGDPFFGIGVRLKQTGDRSEPSSERLFSSSDHLKQTSDRLFSSGDHPKQTSERLFSSSDHLKPASDRLFARICRGMGFKDSGGVLLSGFVRDCSIYSFFFNESEEIVPRTVFPSFSMTRTSFFSLMKKTKQKYRPEGYHGHQKQTRVHTSRLGQYYAKSDHAVLNISEPLRFAPFLRSVFNGLHATFLTLYRPRPIFSASANCIAEAGVFRSKVSRSRNARPFSSASAKEDSNLNQNARLMSSGSANCIAEAGVFSSKVSCSRNARPMSSGSANCIVEERKDKLLGLWQESETAKNVTFPNYLLAFTDWFLPKSDHNLIKGVHLFWKSNRSFRTSDHKLATSSHLFGKGNHLFGNSDYSFVKSDHKLATSNHKLGNGVHLFGKSDRSFGSSDHKLATSSHKFGKSDYSFDKSDYYTQKGDHKLVTSSYKFGKGNHLFGNSDPLLANSDYQTARSSYLFARILADIAFKRPKGVLLSRMVGSSSIYVRQTFGRWSGQVRDSFDSCSSGLRQLFDSCSTALRLGVEEQAKRSRSGVEPVPKESRSRVEEFSKDTRTTLEAESKDLEVFRAPVRDQRQRRSAGCFVEGLAYSLQLTVIILLFGTVALGQSGAKSIAGEDIMPLQIGDTIPDVLWKMPLPVVNHPDGKETVTLDDYRDKKLIILDFWATWCAPCIRSLDKLDSLQPLFADDLQIIPITQQDKGIASNFVQDRQWGHLSAYGRSDLQRYFPHATVPHQVWIRDGQILALTGSEYTEGRFIADVIRGGNPFLFMKEEDLSFDPKVPLFARVLDADSRWQNSVGAFSILTHQQPDLPNAREWWDGHTWMMTNMTIPALYARAFADSVPLLYYSRRLLIEVADSVQVHVTYPRQAIKYDRKIWLADNTYCYHVGMSVGTDQGSYRTRLQRELNAYFGSRYGIEGRIEQRKTELFELSIADAAIFHNSSREAGQDTYHRVLRHGDVTQYADINVQSLNARIVQLNRSMDIPVVNKVFSDRIFTISFPHGADPLSDLATCNAGLAKVGLQLVRKTDHLPMLVIRSLNNQ